MNQPSHEFIPKQQKTNNSRNYIPAPPPSSVPPNPLMLQLQRILNKHGINYFER